MNHLGTSRTRGSSLCDIAISLVADIMYGLEPQPIKKVLKF